MIDKNFFEEIGQKVTKLLPKAEAAGDDMKRSAAAAMQKGFARMDLLTREEFEAQLAALVRAEQKIVALEAQLVQLESRVKELETSKDTDA